MSSGLGGNPNWDSPKLRISAGSLVTPLRVYDIDLGSGERTLLREQPVLGGYRVEDYVERREWAQAGDGTRIPVSIVHRAGVELPAPALLYGYGAYEICTDPSFSVARLSLLDRGMVFAIAHVRGGGEMGRLWYEHGKLLEKKNTFTDFVAVAKHLVESGLTRPQDLVALGGSAGGLLMGAVANLAPDLFAGILAQVPFVDPLTTILDPSLPLTVTEWDEWGNPLSDSDVYAYMKSYSPYENVETKPYPAILAMTSLNDTRVYYVEPAKWVAALRHANPDSNPVLLKTQMAAGHGGVSGRYRGWEETAFQYSWLLAAANCDNDSGG
jgi:oligopeptidase B